MAILIGTSVGKAVKGTRALRARLSDVGQQAIDAAGKVGDALADYLPDAIMPADTPDSGTSAPARRSKPAAPIARKTSAQTMRARKASPRAGTAAARQPRRTTNAVTSAAPNAAPTGASKRTQKAAPKAAAKPAAARTRKPATTVKRAGARPQAKKTRARSS